MDLTLLDGTLTQMLIKKVVVQNKHLSMTKYLHFTLAKVED